MILIENDSSIVFTQGDTLKLKVEISNPDGTPYDEGGELLLKLYKVTYSPIEGVQDIHSWSCTLPHEQLTMQYKKTVFPYREENIVSASTSTFDEYGVGILTIKSNETSQWETNTYEYKLQLVKDGGNEKEYYTLSQASFSVI